MTVAVLITAMVVVLLPTAPAVADYDDTALTNAWEINGEVVYDIMRSGDVMYVGGNFNGPVSPSGTNYSQPNLVAFDADTGAWISSFNPDINGAVESIEPNSDGSMLYVGGHFSMVNGVTRYSVVALDPATGATIPGWTATLRAGDIAYDIEVDGNDVYIGGKFIKVNNIVSRRIARVDATTGALDTVWKPNPDNQVLDMALAPDGDRIYAVGRFLNLDGVFTNAVVAIDTATGDVASGWSNTAVTQARAVDATEDRVAVAYRKTNWVDFYDTAGNQIDKLKGDGDFQELEIVADRVLVGSHSFTFDGLPQAKVQAAFLADATVSTTLDAPAFGQPGVFAIYASGPDLWVGGDIWKIGTTSLTRLGIVPGDPTQSGPTLPTGLTATYLPANEISLSWTASTDDTGVLGYRVLKSGNQVAFVTAGTSWTDVSAQLGVTYVYNIEAVDDDYNISDRGAPATVTAIPDTTAPTAPGAPVAGAIAQTTVDLTWSGSTDNIGVDHYEIVRDGAVIDTSLTTSFTDTGLNLGTAYDYLIRAVDPSGNTSSDSPVTTVTTAADTSAPDQPAAPTLASASLTDIALEWIEPLDDIAVISYRVFRDGVEVATPLAPTTAFTDTGLAPGTSYAYTVTALDAAGNESVASAATVMATTPDTTPPDVPPYLAATPAAGSVDLTWDEPFDDVLTVSYRVLRDGVEVAAPLAPTTNFTDIGLTPATSYDYTVTALDAAGNESGAAAITTSTTPDTTAPHTPPNLAAAPAAASVDLTWDESFDDVVTVSYRVLRDGVEVAAPLTPTTNFTDIGLTPATSYDYTVTALDAAGNESVAAAITTSTTPDTTAPDQPAAPTLVSASLSEITVEWIEPLDNIGVISYRVFRDGVEVATPLAPTTAFTDSGLSPMTAYDYTVSALDAAGNESVVSVGTTLATSDDTTAPEVPLNLAAAATEASVTLDWNEPFDDVGVVSYRVVRDGVEVDSPVAPTSEFVDTGLVPSTSYGYEVTALDAAGNESVAATLTTSTSADSTGPTQPGAPSATATTSTTISLTWSESTDAVGVVEYDILRDSVVVGSVPTLVFLDTGLLTDTTYTYTVLARDAAGNESILSPATALATVGDIEPPTTPGAPVAVVVSETSVGITWAASSDNVAVTGYQILRDGAVVGTSTTTDFTDNGLAPGANYDYSVRSIDAAGNQSTESSQTTISTQGDTVPPDTIAITPTNGQQFSSGIATFSGTATDNVGVGAVYVAVKNVTPGDQNNGQWLQLDLVSWGGFKRLPVTMANPGATSTTFTEDITLPNGNYGVSFVVDDTSGNRDPSKPWRTFTVTGSGGGNPDLESPVAAISSPNWNQNISGPSITFTGTATDNVGVTEVDILIRDRNTNLYLRQDGTFGNFQRLTTTLTNPGDPSATWTATYDLPPGSYWVKTIAEDAVGNQSNKPKRNFTVN